MKLLIHSKSTLSYAKDLFYHRSLLISEYPTRETFELMNTEEDVVAIGGGSVIDTGKILSKNPIIAIPTTLSGASETSHAVYWDKDRKLDVNTPKPVTLGNADYLRTLSSKVLGATKCDCIGHVVDSSISKYATQTSRFLVETAITLMKVNTLKSWLGASLLAGAAIEITGTNITHALSYPITSFYRVSHGEAVGFFISKILAYYALDGLVEAPQMELNIDLEKIVNEALTYSKIFSTKKKIDKDILIGILK